jgi:hypothetical protein
MAIDYFPLLNRLQVGSYNNCVILTYSADLYFFEQVVWPTLRSRGCCNNLVIMDSRQYVSSLDTTGSLLHRLGKSYSVWPVSAAKAFHPKLIFQTNEKEGRLIIGSGNLTVRGFSTNWELFSEIAFTTDSGTSGIFAEAWKLITESAKGATKAVRRQLGQVRATSGSVLSSEGNENWPRLLFASPDQPSLLNQLKSLVGKATVRRLIIVSPFFDSQLRAVRELEKAFGVKDVIAVVQSQSVSFPGNVAKTVKALAVHEFVPPYGGKSGYLHGKAYVIQTPTIEYCVWGSANCSMAALAGEGNYEAVLVTKGKVGDGIATLGLGASIAKAQKINPSKLDLATKTSKRADAALCITSAEVDRGDINIVIAPIARFSKCGEGRLKLWSKGVPIGELRIGRTDSLTFAGLLNRSKGGSSVICRLILEDNSGEKESTPFAVHFLEDLEEATRTRLQARMHRLVEAIHSGTFDWAKGLESVCELVIKIGLHDNAEKPAGKDGMTRGKKQVKAPDPDGDAIVGDYEDFVSDAEDDRREANESQARNFLEDVVATLRAQIMRAVTKDDDKEDEAGNRDSWRYREESEREAAESGASETPHHLSDLEALEQEHSRVHRAYVRLMSGLNRRYESLRSHGKEISTDEFWRLDAVNLLLLDGCGRLLEEAHDLGPVLAPEDVMHEYLPAVAVFLGRIRVIGSSSDGIGPLLDWAQMDQSDAGIMNTLRSTCALLTGLVAHWRQEMQPTFDDESLAEWSHYTEIVVARCLAAILRRTPLPTQEEIFAVADRSTWLASIGCNPLGEVFKDLCRLARSIVRCEDHFTVERIPHSPQDLSPGDWVCAASCGVTEVVRVSGSQIQIAMIGQSDTDEEWFREVESNSLQRTNIPTKVRQKDVEVAKELDHLLAYDDQDFEEWRDLIMPQLLRSYLVPLQKVRQRARSSQLRNEAARQLERNAQWNSPTPTPVPKITLPE